jgi:hypothetical protein
MKGIFKVEICKNISIVFTGLRCEFIIIILERQPPNVILFELISFL